MFFSFPISKFEVDQGKEWIAAVRRKNLDGSTWVPKLYDRICSAHFVVGDKSDDKNSPSYVPTIFPSEYYSRKINEKSVPNRYKRMVKRNAKRNQRASQTNSSTWAESARQSEFNQLHHYLTESNQEIHQVLNPDMINVPVEEEMCDQGCQVEMFDAGQSQLNSTFFIYRCDQGNNLHNVKIQTNIIVTTIIVHAHKKMKDKMCGTHSEKVMIDKSVEPIPDCAEEFNIDVGFKGYESVKKAEQLLDSAGVSNATFQLLLKRLEQLKGDNWKVKRENRLLAFLMRMKNGLTFSAISVLFSVGQSTISRIFFQTLQHLVSATQDFVFWPSKALVQDTMPQCFKPNFGNTRVIIDCTEFRIECPCRIDDRVWCYLHYKHGFTCKCLICITPGGFISFKSKVAGGRMSDSQITVESGLLDLLEEGDVVLADKGFPEIKTVLDASGKSVVVVMPPFLSNKKEFTKEETEATYSIASVRIHVERIMQRLRTYKILDKIPRHLFKHIDDILHMSCVLVNLQPPIFSEENDEESSNL